VVHGFVKSIELLNYLNLRVPQCKNISTNTFYTQLYGTNYLINVPIATQVDLFNFNSIESFYNYIINYYA